jgi:hypothetical protein
MISLFDLFTFFLSVLDWWLVSYLARIYLDGSAEQPGRFRGRI